MMMATRIIAIHPYTTHFRSRTILKKISNLRKTQCAMMTQLRQTTDNRIFVTMMIGGRSLKALLDTGATHSIIDKNIRSEEHTSELQSRENLVCSLLPDK